MISRVPMLAFVAGIAYFLCLYGLGNVGFLSTDEPRYAWIGRAMAESGDWITPRLYGEPWFEKPPLLYWMMAAAWKLGLRDEWAARLPVALLALAFLAFYYHALRRHFENRETALAAAIMLGTSIGWLAYAHIAVMDLPLTATFGAAMLLALRGRLIASGAMLGLAVLAKALVPLVLALPLLWWFRRRLTSLIVPTLVMLAVAAPWYVFCYLRHGRPFLDELFIRHHFARFLDARAEVLHPQPVWFYLPVLLAGLLPWTPVLAALRPRALWTNDQTRFFLLWFGFGFVFLSAASGKLPGYLLPLLPALCALAACSLETSPLNRTLERFGLPLAVVLVAVPDPALWSAVLTGIGEVRLGTWHWPWLLLAAAFALYPPAVTCRTVAVAVLMSCLWPQATRTLDRLTARAYVPLAAAHPDACAGPELHRAWRYGLAYYLRRPLPMCAEENDPRPRLTSEGPRVTVSVPDPVSPPPAPSPPAR